MKTYFAFAASLLVASVAMIPAPAQAQNGGTSGITSPIVIHQTSTKQTKKSQSQTSSSNTWLKAEVLHADGNSMVVAEQDNQRVIHTFTYADKVKAQISKINDKGGYQYGDKIKILYVPGSTVALKIHGKPSKPS